MKGPTVTTEIDQNERLQIRLARTRNYKIKRREKRYGPKGPHGEPGVEDSFVCAKCKKAGGVLAVITKDEIETTRCKPCLTDETVLPHQWDEAEALRAELLAKA